MILLDVLVYLLIIIFILSILLSLPDHAKSFFKRKHLWDKTNKKGLIILIFCLLLAFFVSIRFNAFNNIQNHIVNRIIKTCNFAIHKFGVYPLYYFVSFFIDIENTNIDRYISNESKTFINISYETIFPPNILSFYKKNIKDKSAKISSFIHFNQLRVFITEKFNNLIQFFSKQPIFFKAKPFFLPIAKIFSVLLFLFNIYFITEHYVISSMITFPFSVSFNFCRIAFYIAGLFYDRYVIILLYISIVSYNSKEKFINELVCFIIFFIILAIIGSLNNRIRNLFKRKHIIQRMNKLLFVVFILAFCSLFCLLVIIKFIAFSNIQKHFPCQVVKACNFAYHKFGAYPLYKFSNFFINIENTSIDQYISSESKRFIEFSKKEEKQRNLKIFNFNLNENKAFIKAKDAANSFNKNYISPSLNKTKKAVSSFNEKYINSKLNQTKIFIDSFNSNYVKPKLNQTKTKIKEINEKYINPKINETKKAFRHINIKYINPTLNKTKNTIKSLSSKYISPAVNKAKIYILTFYTKYINPQYIKSKEISISIYQTQILPHYLKLKTIVTPYYNKYIGPKVNTIINWLSIFNITKYKYYKRFRQFMTDAFNQITQYLTQKSLFNKLKPTLISISKIITILTLLFNIYILFEFNVVSSVVLLPLVFIFYISRFIWLFLKIFITFAVYIFAYFMIKLPLVIFNDIIGLMKTCCIPETAMKYYELINQMPIVVGDNRYPTEMVKYKPKFWEDPSIYDSPLYSDLHPPIFCESYEMMDQILENIYKVPDDLTYCLGGKNVIKRYSQLVTSALRQKNSLQISNFGNEKIYAIIRCPLDLGFQRNQHPNSLYNLVRERKVKIVFITMGSVYIKIKNIISSIINFFFPKGSVVDLPYGQQPVYIKTEWSGTLKPGEEAECHLNWQCMCDFDHGPRNDPRLTPFIIAGPEDLCEHYYWPKVQPNNSLRLSKTNELWDMNPEINSLGTPLLKDVNGWNYPDANNGGLIDPELFDMLNKNCDKKIVNIYGVSRSFNGQIEFGAYRSSIQSGIVAQLEDRTYICLEKSTSNYWNGGACQIDVQTGKFEFDNEEYVKEWTKHFTNNSCCGSLIAGMRTDPNNNSSQDSRQHLMSELGEYVPAPSKSQIFVDGLHDLANDISTTLHKYTDDIPFIFYFVPVVGPILTGIDCVKLALDFTGENLEDFVISGILYGLGGTAIGVGMKQLGKVWNAGKDLVKGVTGASKKFKNDVSHAKKQYDHVKAQSNNKAATANDLSNARKQFWNDTKNATKEFGQQTGNAIKQFGKDSFDIGKEFTNDTVKGIINYGKDGVQACINGVKKSYYKAGEIKNDFVDAGCKFGNRTINAGKDLKSNLSRAVNEKKGLEMNKEIGKSVLKYGKDNVQACWELTKDIAKMGGKYSKQAVVSVGKGIKDTFVGDFNKLKAGWDHVTNKLKQNEEINKK